ncbi:GNAT family N-acetyltransferase [Nostoc sp. NZL]|uniref:GNAT family N-acetyltransferase n=1 Tax=Nostoc sp. NZL TaxID=2650612 RepID=UPI0018C49CF5|nr:GNAT family N-acetyltransferase [Nostoc sp. NZL]MBG1240600.1 GNAT family N-acetyltransferase [Nostoc sp. NZL]
MFTFYLINESNARAILSWRYEPPYDLYNYSEQEANSLQHILHSQNNFYSIVDKNSELVAYCSFGQDGQVTGGDYRNQALDVGMGIRPDLAGRGKGTEYANAVLEFADSLFNPKAFRVTIAAFNKRAIRVWQKLEFEYQQSFERENDGMQFIILLRADRCKTLPNFDNLA